MYDSREDTMKHKDQVFRLMLIIMEDLRSRLVTHDDSKLESPEKEIFDEFTPKLKDVTYGSDEYKGYLKSMGEGLKHHYANNRHHAEHWNEGIEGMNLVDLMEMVCDWKASTMRHNDGDIYRSIDINADRFGYDLILAKILTNTAKLFE